MKLELILNPNAEGYDQLQHELREELRALRKVEYNEVSEPAPSGLLAVEHDVVKFVFEHPTETIGLATALVELVRAAIERLNLRAKKGEPPAVILAKKKTLPLPSSAGREKRFLDWIRRGAPEGPSPRAKRPRKNSRSKAPGRKRGKR